MPSAHFAATLVGTAEFYLGTAPVTRFQMGEIGDGSHPRVLTFTGSLMAAGKLQEILPQRPITYQGQNFVNLSVARSGARDAPSASWCIPRTRYCFPIMVGVALIFGVLLVIPIGGADMPTVISLLNSYAGFSAAAAGIRAESVNC